ncbi:MAG: hypothetical protein NTX86_02245 [Candidatus Dependentiae bacterium]|nr:hypothetical protein [Candidatus Dependentiae bacterium]
MKSLQLCIFFILISGCCAAYGASHTFFTPRQITTDPTFELALTDYDMYHGDKNDFQLSVKPFYQRSTQGKKSAAFFLPHNKCCVAVRENGTGDINPLWFNVISASGTLYSSTLCCAPQRTTYGGVLTFYANFNRWLDGLWLLANTAIMGATHTMHVRETDRTENGTIPDFTNMCDGFNNPDWCAGKIKCCGEKTKAGLDDIQIKIGYDFDCPKVDHIALYGVLTIPTGNRPTSYYLFEPLVGSKHVTLGVGLNADYVLCEREDNSWTILGDCKYRYAFSAHERRSFDLCDNGDWSRYLLVVDQSQPLNSLPGINYFTLPTKVTPRSTVDFWLALHHRHCNWDIEIGYDLWWRQKEKVALRCCNNALSNNTIGIYDMSGVCGTNQTSASTATIAQSFGTVVSDAIFVPLTVSDLNLSSAAHPNVLTNKIYAAIARPYAFRCFAGLFGLGGSYEFAQHNAAFNQWALWADVGLAF